MLADSQRGFAGFAGTSFLGPCTLTSLLSRLTKNELNDEAAEGFAEMLKVNQTLQHLW